MHRKDCSKNMCLVRNWHLDADAIIMTYNLVEVRVLRTK